MRRSRLAFLYTPQDGDDADKLADRAYRCGLDLPPKDKRARWIDDPRPARADLIESYHAGQAERYESEDW